MTPRRSLGLALAGLLALTAGAAAGDDDPAAAPPCRQAERALKARDLVRASIAAADCDAGSPVEGARLLAAIEQQAIARGYSPIEIVTRPTGGMVMIDAAADHPFAAPRLVWLPPGSHDVTGLVDGQPVVRSTVRAHGGHRGAALLVLPAPRRRDAPTKVDFSEDGGGGDTTRGPPPDAEFGSLLPDRYQRGVAGAVGWGHPLAIVRPRRWLLAIGPARGSRDAGWGAMLEVGRAVELGVDGRDPRFALVPRLGVSLMRGEAAPHLGAHGAATLQVSTALAAGHRGALGVGPGATVGRGVAALDGVSLGAVAVAEYQGRRLGAVLRVELPVVSSATARLTTGGLLLGARW